jgi:hypothetical protein
MPIPQRVYGRRTPMRLDRRNCTFHPRDRDPAPYNVTRGLVIRMSHPAHPGVTPRDHRIRLHFGDRTPNLVHRIGIVLDTRVREIQEPHLAVEQTGHLFCVLHSRRPHFLRAQRTQRLGHLAPRQKQQHDAHTQRPVHSDGTGATHFIIRVSESKQQAAGFAGRLFRCHHFSRLYRSGSSTGLFSHAHPLLRDSRPLGNIPKRNAI